MVASVPLPGFPEGIATRGNCFYANRTVPAQRPRLRRRGNPYVTRLVRRDHLQGPRRWWRARGEVPDPALAGNPAIPFGVNGLRIDKNNKKVYVTVTIDATFTV